MKQLFMRYLLTLFVLCLPFQLWAIETITFMAEDGVEVVADLYMPHEKSAPFIILFHQANWSRGEYMEIAPKLNAKGFNCMAVDLRSGGGVNDIKNQTKINAIKAMKETQYINTIPDIKAAIKHAKENFVGDKLIIWGSSYSAALVIKIAGDMPEAMDAVLSFSPGEYFGGQSGVKHYVASSAKLISKPVFITSARNEKGSWWPIYESIQTENKVFYLPETAGNHGSRALWNKFNDSRGYWTAVEKFLKGI